MSALSERESGVGSQPDNGHRHAGLRAGKSSRPLYGRIGRRLAAGVAASLLIAAQAIAADAPKKGAHPDLSGYWNNTSKVPANKSLMDKIAPNTAVLIDSGAFEYPQGEFGGLKLKPKAAEAAKTWDPLDDMKLSNACKPPSIVYAMQGPFPMEVLQGTEFIIIKLEYFDMMRVIFMDGRKPDAATPDSKLGFSVGRWEGDTLIVETDHLEPATITNNGLGHSNKVRLLERFRLSPDGSTLLSTQEFEDPEMLENRGARFIAWKKKAGEHVYPYECDPTFAIEYQNQIKQGK